MSVSSDRTELERQKRRQKIEQHFKEGTAKAETKAASQATRKAQLKDAHTPAPKVESLAELEALQGEIPPSPVVPPSAASPFSSPAPTPSVSSVPALKPWQRWERNRIVQFRPLTRRELEAEQDAKFFASVTKDDEAHKEKRKKADEEAKRWAKEDRQRREHEERTGMRPWEPGRYISVEEAGKRGYLAGNGA